MPRKSTPKIESVPTRLLELARQNFLRVEDFGFSAIDELRATAGWLRSLANEDAVADFDTVARECAHAARNDSDVFKFMFREMMLRDVTTDSRGRRRCLWVPLNSKHEAEPVRSSGGEDAPVADGHPDDFLRLLDDMECWLYIMEHAVFFDERLVPGFGKGRTAHDERNAIESSPAVISHRNWARNTLGRSRKETHYIPPVGVKENPEPGDAGWRPVTREDLLEPSTNSPNTDQREVLGQLYLDLFSRKPAKNTKTDAMINRIAEKLNI